MFGGLPKGGLARWLGRSAAVVGVVGAVFSGPIQAQQTPAEAPIAPPSPVDLIEAGTQVMQDRETNLEALEGDPDAPSTSDPPLLDLPTQVVNPWDIDDRSQNWVEIPPDIGTSDGGGDEPEDPDDTQPPPDSDPFDPAGDPTTSPPVVDDGESEPGVDDPEPDW